MRDCNFKNGINVRAYLHSYLKFGQLEGVQHPPDLLDLLPVRGDDAHLLHRQATTRRLRGAILTSHLPPQLLQVQDQLVGLSPRGKKWLKRWRRPKRAIPATPTATLAATESTRAALDTYFVRVEPAGRVVFLEVGTYEKEHKTLTNLRRSRVNRFAAHPSLRGTRLVCWGWEERTICPPRIACGWRRAP